MKKYLQILLALFLVASLCIPIGSTFAQQNEDTSSNMLVANDHQLQTIKEIWGKPISIAEYYEIVYPGELSKILKVIPEESQKILYELQWSWPDISEPAHSAIHTQNMWSGQTIGGGVTDATVIVGTWTNAPYTPMANCVAHGYKMETTPPTSMLTLSCSEYLYYYTGEEPGELVGSFSNWGGFISELVGLNYEYETREGMYKNTTSSYFISPPTYTPIAGSYSGSSGWWWVDP
jgi:hypothetical protein